MADVELALLIDRFMRRVHMDLQAKAPSFDQEKVGQGGGIVLLTLADKGRLEMHELSRQVARDKSQMTRAIRSLEIKGLVQRAASPDDARVSLVSLTKDGEHVVDKLRLVLAETISDLLEPMSDQEKHSLKALMKQVAL